MRWPSKQAGFAYSRILLHFGEKPFLAEEVRSILNVNRSQLAQIFHKLHESRLLLLTRRSRPRIYRVLNPTWFPMVFGDALQENVLLNLHQDWYIPVILAIVKQAMDWDPKAAVVLFGSTARGTATPNSDIDFLIISDEWGPTYSVRWPIIHEWKTQVRPALRMLCTTGIYAQPSLLPLTSAELESWKSFLIDVVGEELILRDPKRTYERFTLKLRSWLVETGVQRRYLSKGRYYWKLGASNFTPNEEIPA